MHGLELPLALVVGVAVVAVAARRSGLPAPVLLVVVGIVVAEIPGVPRVRLEPDVILVLVLPPLLYAAALESSLIGVRRNLRPIGLLSVGLVLFTAFAVAAVAMVVVPGLPFAVALALGAIVAPPDAVAAGAIARRVGLPSRVLTILEGESLLNDATALVLYRVAVAAAVSGTVSLPEAAGSFAVASVGGVGTGLAVAWLVATIRRRMDDPLVENTISLLTPFAAYLPAEAFGASGVVAVVVCGLYLGHLGPRETGSRTRLQSQMLWKMINFLLEGVVFALIGLQLPEIVEGLGEYSASTLAGSAAAVLGCVLLTRPLWIFPATYLARLVPAVRGRDPAPGWQAPAVLSWAGMRGVVSLAAAFALPHTVDGGGPFPQRNLLLFVTFVAIIGTLVLQGLTLGRVIRALGLSPDRHRQLLEEAGAQHAAITAALRRLDELVEDDPPPDGVADRLRELAENRRLAAWERLGGGDGGGDAETPSAAYRRLRREMLASERAHLIELRDAGRLSDEVLRRVQRELDLEEIALSRD